MRPVTGPMLRTALLLSVLSIAGIVSAVEAPYAGQEQRDIKVLSAEDVNAYLAGKGMGLAKEAELNGYPGPAHVLELAPKLGLTSEQRARTEALFTSMSQKASSLGREIVSKERELDRRFSSRDIDQTSLSRLLDDIGTLQGQLRAAHLEAHLDQTKILTAQQTARYIELRGYGNGETSDRHGSHRH